MKLPTKKTPQSARDTYTYPSVVKGCSVTLRPGENGVTEEHIKTLHALDDAEVYNNLKNHRPALTKEEKACKKKWAEKHPGEEYLTKWVLSLEAVVEDGIDTDKSHIAYDTAVNMDFADETVCEMLERHLPYLTELQRMIFYLCKAEGYTQTEVAKMLSCSVANVNKHLKKATREIDQHNKK